MHNHEEFGTGAILQGAGRIAAAVGATLGPAERPAIINPKDGRILITSSAKTIVREAELKNPFEKIGARMIRDVVNRMDTVAHGGCATGAVLAHAIFREGLNALASGAQPVPTIRGINNAVKLVIAELGKLARPVPGEMIAQVGAISANNDSAIGDIIAEAMDKVGKDGGIVVEEAKGLDTTFEVVEGMRFDRGYLSLYFVNDPEREEVKLDDAYVLIHEKKISSVKDLLPVLEAIAKTGKPFILIAEDVEGEALTTLVVNKVRGTLSCVAVKAPGSDGHRKAMLEDIAVLTGGTTILEGASIKLEAVKLEDLGRAKRVIVDKENTTIVDGVGQQQAIRDRIAQLRSEVEKTGNQGMAKVKSLFRGQPEPEDPSHRGQLQERLAKLAGGVAIIRVGAPTESEMKEKKACVENAVHMTQAAAREGVVPGGGVALLRASRRLLDIADDPGAAIVARACEEPFRVIAAAAGLEADVALSKVAGASDAFYGVNALTGVWQDLFAAGIVDSVRVIRLALEVGATESVPLINSETAAFDP